MDSCVEFGSKVDSYFEFGSILKANRLQKYCKVEQEWAKIMAKYVTATIDPRVEFAREAHSRECQF